MEVQTAILLLIPTTIIRVPLLNFKFLIPIFSILLLKWQEDEACYSCSCKALSEASIILLIHLFLLIFTIICILILIPTLFILFFLKWEEDEALQLRV